MNNKILVAICVLCIALVFVATSFAGSVDHNDISLTRYEREHLQALRDQVRQMESHNRLLESQNRLLENQNRLIEQNTRACR